MVVLPDDSGPKISQMRPRGNPPTPKAASSEIDPLEMTLTGTSASFEPSRRIEPLPNCFSIWPRAVSKARERSRSSMGNHSWGGELRPIVAAAIIGAGIRFMLSRVLVILFAGSLVWAGAKRITGSGRGENQDIILNVTVYSDPESVK